MTRRIKRRMVRRLNNNIPLAERTQIDAEIDALPIDDIDPLFDRGDPEDAAINRGARDRG